MIEIPAGIEATPAEIDEATEVVSLIAGSGESVAAALARDLATGIGRLPVRITFDDTVGAAAASYWVSVLTAAGIEAAIGENSPFATPPARIHLHGHRAGRAGYAGLAADESAGLLVGEVMGQGHSAAARFCSLAAVGDALATGLGSAPLDVIN